MCRRIPIVSVLARLGVDVSRHSALRGWVCPACHEARRANGTGVLPKDPCAWHCFRCGAAGTAIDLWLLHHGRDPKRLEDADYALLEGLSGESLAAPIEAVVRPPSMTPAQVQGYWRTYQRHRDPRVREWLSLVRGITPVEYGTMSAALLPSERWQDLQRAGVAVFPLRSTRDGEIRNLALRPVQPDGAKLLTLVSGEGACSHDGWPLSYGHREELQRGALLLVEGALDWQAARSWAPTSWGVMGARCAGDIASRWPLVLKDYPGRIIMIPHLDKLDFRGERAGPDACRKFREQIPRAEWFPWSRFWELLGAQPHDLADAPRSVADGGCGVDPSKCAESFRKILSK